MALWLFRRACEDLRDLLLSLCSIPPRRLDLDSTHLGIWPASSVALISRMTCDLGEGGTGVDGQGRKRRAHATRTYLGGAPATAFLAGTVRSVRFIA